MRKKITLLFLLSVVLCIGKYQAQTFSPISLTGYNYDAVAEATTALAHTSGPLDASDYVLYSANYASIYSSGTGLPNNGLIPNGSSSYQLALYTQNNMLFSLANTTDSLMLVTPASYAGISILCFSTEGNGSMNVIVRFTDNTTQVFNNQSLIDWFSSGTAVISGFDRVSRNGTTPANVTGNPKMFAIDLPISCANRSKMIRSVIFVNTGTNPRNCIMAISGVPVPVYQVTTTPVSCSGGTNGSATITVNGGLPPYTYTWSTSPVQTASVVGGLATGVYTVTARDLALCPISNTFAITQSLTPQPPLIISATIYTLCTGRTVTLSTSGATSYTWSTSANSTSIIETPLTTTQYSVGGFNAFNCYLTGSVNIVVNPLPSVTFSLQPDICINATAITLTANPSGGVYSGAGVISGAFHPGSGTAGTKTISYSYTDANGCNSISVNTITVNALPNMSFTLSENSLCVNSPTLLLSGTPANGTFAGTGVTSSVYTPSVAGAGSQSVTYSYTDANNCTNSITSSVFIHPVPIIDIQTTKKLYCITDRTITLSTSAGGGTFTGQGITPSGVFSPTLAGPGNHVIVYTYTDHNGCTGNASFSATVSTCSGINENSINSPLLIYPNPSPGVFTIKTERNTQITISNGLGQLINEYTLHADNSYQINISNLPNGIYFISGKDDQQLFKHKVVISK